jgi:esterase/lipase superfamily enzyme
MRREYLRLFSPAIGREMDLLAYGHAGVPVLAFPTSEGMASEFEEFWMVRVLSHLLTSGRLRLYCVGSHDSESWHASHLPAYDRAWRHSLYEQWILEQVLPAIAADTGKRDGSMLVTGCGFGAFHAANFALKHPRRFHHAICLSGTYDVRPLVDGHHDDWVYFNNPMQYVAGMQGDVITAVRNHTFITLVCGQGPWESQSLNSTKAFWSLLSEREVPNYMDLWGTDAAQDWHWWREQIVYYLTSELEGTLPWRRAGVTVKQ